MKATLNKIQNRIDQDPKLKEAISRIKPQKNLWGIAGIVLFFFIPELVTYIWNAELISWTHVHSITEPLALQRWLYENLEEMFATGVSWLNLTLGALFLWWVLRYG